MGYYFEKARSKKDLNPKQLERYKALRSGDEPLPQALIDRIEAVKKYVGPIFSGEIWAALEELVQDAFVAWVFAGEDPSKIQWSDPEDLIVPPPPPSEEEKRRTEQWKYEFFKKVEADRRELELAKKRTWWDVLRGLFSRWI